MTLGKDRISSATSPQLKLIPQTLYSTQSLVDLQVGSAFGGNIRPREYRTRRDLRSLFSSLYPESTRETERFPWEPVKGC